MDRRLIPSSNIKSVGYDRFSGDMEVEYMSGRIYTYRIVPQIVHDGLVTAQSPGSFMKTWVEGRFPSKELTSQGGNDNA